MGFRLSLVYPPFPASCAFRATMAPLTSPPSQIPPCRFPRSGFLRCYSPHRSKNVQSEGAIKDGDGGVLCISPTSVPSREFGD